MRVAKDNAKVALKQFKIERYYCPNTSGNPWLPATPGAHGFMFIGMSELDQTVGQGECCEVFLGFGQNDWRYFGSYACTRVAPLTPKDFDSLSAVDKKRYSKFTKDKKLAASEDEALRRYQEGTLRVPCVRMECQSFNHELFQALRDNLLVVPAFTPTVKRQRSSSAAQRSSPSSNPTTPRGPRSSVRLQAVLRPSCNEDEYDLPDDVAPPPKKRKSCESDAPPLVTDVLIHPSDQSLHATD
ncbi:hypothetical protein EXIGLDRAFT_143730 [Exidia glandulosa HHB12029]|uniref:DUF6697 domain-containing protein n=1 Tax=Exidia glandulosa HHB12029 TaxID=1314781 RepID=A0A165NBW5_EXIGL|nr:hypothetical protein EXIGLDRAFT_143730 [Exidia glandulosa HHB12029]